MTTGNQQPQWKFPFDEAERVFLNVLRRREALLNQPGFDPTDPTVQQQYGLDGDWVAFAEQVYTWTYRTHYAAVVVGLLARATADVNPLCLQEMADVPHPYAAASVWKIIYSHGLREDLYLNLLKGIPFNNSPYNGKKVMTDNWDNTKPQTRHYLSLVVDALTPVAGYTRQQAEDALLSFLVAPTPPGAVPPAAQTASAYATQVPLGVTVPSLVGFAKTVEQFVAVLSDDGRRAQAFVTAVLEVGGFHRVYTAPSINDPSRNYPGDVTVWRDGGFGPFYVEVKDKTVSRQDVEDYARTVGVFDPQGFAGYAAFANTDRIQAGLKATSRIPGSEYVSKTTQTPTVVWRSPLEALLACGFWSGLPQDVVVWRVAVAYRKWLDYLDGGRHSGVDWQLLIDAWGNPTQTP